MAKEFVEKLGVLLAPTLAALPAGVTVEIRHFFSGAAAYADNRISISLTPAGLAMKLAEDGRAKLLAEGAEPLRYFPKATIKKQYVILPEAMCGDAEQFRFWARQSIDYVLTLPAPKRKS
jgi:TfoX/Sxy family transcriptional regulator of competence genes